MLQFRNSQRAALACGVSQHNASKLSGRNDLTPAKVQKVYHEIKQDGNVTDPAALLVHRLNEKSFGRVPEEPPNQLTCPGDQWQAADPPDDLLAELGLKREPIPEAQGPSLQDGSGY